MLKKTNALIADDLYQQGFSVQPCYFSQALIQQLATEALNLHQAKQTTKAGIGRNQQFQQNNAVRQDYIHWLTGDSPAQQHYLRAIDDLKHALNRNLMLGLCTFETHYAVYEAGAFYKQHYDSFQGNSNRIVSVVTYLNDSWTPENGGELLLYANDQRSVMQRVLPLAGTLVVFLSEQIPHEVAVTHQQRVSIAGWLRLNPY